MATDSKTVLTFLTKIHPYVSGGQSSCKEERL